MMPMDTDNQCPTNVRSSIHDHLLYRCSKVGSNFGGAERDRAFGRAGRCATGGRESSARGPATALLRRGFGGHPPSQSLCSWISRSRRMSSEARHRRAKEDGGADRKRTANLLSAIQVGYVLFLAKFSQRWWSPLTALPVGVSHSLLRVRGSDTRMMNSVASGATAASENGDRRILFLHSSSWRSLGQGAGISAGLGGSLWR